MSAVIPHRARPRLASALLALLAGALMVLAFAPAAVASAAPEGDGEATEIFIGRVQQVEQIKGQTPAGNRVQFTVDVILVFGATTVDTMEAVVRTTPGLDKCPRFPRGPETQRYLFALTMQSNGLIAGDCASIAEFTRQDQPLVVEKYGAARQPVPTPTQPPPPPAPDPVSYMCPDTQEEVATFADDAGGCEALHAPASTDRAAAPGLALVLVGLLGLFVVRRMGRGRGRRA